MVLAPLTEGAATVMAMEAKGCEEEGKGAPAAQPEPQMRGGLCPVQQMRQERREISWAPGMSWPALRASLMAALSGLLGVEKLRALIHILRWRRPYRCQSRVAVTRLTR